MKLDDFLKCKKVKCVEERGEFLTIGEEYDVLDRCVEIKITDDEGYSFWFGNDHFEPVLDSAENPLQNIELTPDFETEASEPKFKVGDKVYLGLSAKIEVIKNFTTINSREYIDVKSGKLCDSEICCHATQENYERLQATFPDIEFEQPPKPLSGDDIVKAMLKKGIKNVLCLWGNGDKIIIDRLDYKGSLMSTNCNIVSGLTPIDWYTGEPLTESILND